MIRKKSCVPFVTLLSKIALAWSCSALFKRVLSPRAALLPMLLLMTFILFPAVLAAQEDSGEEEVEEQPIALDEIVVSASYSLNRSEPVEAVALSRDEILELPTFSDDLYRAVALLPGASGNDISARFTVRGGPYEDVLVRLDGVELFEPFHLKDFAGALSILDPLAIDGLELFPSAFPARFGDRSTAVLDITTRRSMEQRTSFGASFSTATFNRGDVFGSEDQGNYFASLRRGWLDLVFDLVGPDEEEEEEEGAPEYIDAFGKVDWRFSDRSEGGFWALLADDGLEQEEREDDGALEIADTSYGNQWLVAKHQTILSSRAFLFGRAFLGSVDRDRVASELEGETDFDVRDERQLDILGLALDWNGQLGERHLLSAGLEARSYDANYDYVNARAFTDPISGISNITPLPRFAADISGESYSAWVADRWRLTPKWVAEIGLRFDNQTWIDDSSVDDSQVSPRLNLVWDGGRLGLLRAGWGIAYQSHRPNELQIEDGDAAFYNPERAEHRALGWERALGKWRLRLDAYQRLTTDLRPRYESLFSPIVLYPESQPDRVRLLPERSEANGVEIFLQGPRSKRLKWWASYAYSTVEDRIDGVWIPSQIDQTHALTIDVGYQIGRHWNLNAAWIYHTGWPITEVGAELIQGADGPQIVPVLGELYGERVDDYHRLDLRASRSFSVGNGALQLYIDVQNLYNRENERGYEFGADAFALQADGSVIVTPEIDTWLGVLPSFGITWSF